MKTIAIAPSTIRMITQADTPLSLGVGLRNFAFAFVWVFGPPGGSLDGAEVSGSFVVSSAKRGKKKTDVMRTAAKLGNFC